MQNCFSGHGVAEYVSNGAADIFGFPVTFKIIF